MSDVTSAKAALRREMRRIRRCIDDTAERSARISERTIAVLSEAQPGVVMLFEPVAGEPDLADVADWCGRHGVTVVAPRPTPDAEIPIDPGTVDIVVVPGLAFTADGDRLGQGGGWYDRFLATCRGDCVTIGVGFEPQLIGTVPTEPHDTRLDHVVTDAGWASTAALS